MKKLAVILASSIIFIGICNAQTLGIGYLTTSERVYAGQVVCIEYGIGNPSDVSVYAYLDTLGDLKNFTYSVPEPQLIPGHTFYLGKKLDGLVVQKICFLVENFTVDKCPEWHIKGGVYPKATEVSGNINQSGSSVVSSVVAPLELIVVPQWGEWKSLGKGVMCGDYKCPINQECLARENICGQVEYKCVFPQENQNLIYILIALAIAGIAIGLYFRRRK